MVVSARFRGLTRAQPLEVSHPANYGFARPRRGAPAKDTSDRTPTQGGVQSGEPGAVWNCGPIGTGRSAGHDRVVGVAELVERDPAPIVVLHED